MRRIASRRYTFVFPYVVDTPKPPPCVVTVSVACDDKICTLRNIEFEAEEYSDLCFKVDSKLGLKYLKRRFVRYLCQMQSVCLP